MFAVDAAYLVKFGLACFALGAFLMWRVAEKAHGH